MLKKGQQGVIVRRGTGDGMYVSLPEAPFETGDLVRFVVRADDEGDPLLEKNVEEFDESGRAFVYLSPADTLSLEADSYVYGVNYSKNGADPIVIIRSAPFVLEEAVARNG